MGKIYDVIIIGAGPAGLISGSILNKNNINYLIVEKGRSLKNRDPNAAKDVSSGEGGCGLFSDGKLSFYPSASKLWSDYDAVNLKKAYEHLSSIFSDLDISIPFWDDNWVSGDERKIFSGQKKYHSILLEHQERQDMLNYLVSVNEDNMMTDIEVVSVKQSGKIVEIVLSNNEIFFADKVMIATGKFGAKLLENIDPKIPRQHKIEIGIRLKTFSKHFKPYDENVEDYKIIEEIDQDTQFRSFCSCKDGVVIKSQFDNFFSYNGAKTPFKTDKSNIGLLLRSRNSSSNIYNEMNDFLNKEILPFELSLEEFLNSKENFIGRNVDALIKERIFDFIEEDARETTTIFGPEIEYVGEYCNFTNTFSYDSKIYVIGDVNANFRGLVAAFLTGIYSAEEIVKERNLTIKKDIDMLGIKISNSDPMPLVFTAQSKKMFYCKEVICEYVLKQKKLPINPFMIFGYFLNDRVERDLVRQGNNQLIRSSEELWVFGPIADGVLFEIAHAKILNKPIRYFKLGTRIEEIEEITNLNEVAFEPEVHSKQIKKTDLIKFISGIDSNYNQMSLFELL